MESGNDIAHKISSGHREYTEADTQAMYDRKVAERAALENWIPKLRRHCRCWLEACKTCPVLGKVKSPLKIRATVSTTTEAISEDAPHAEQSFTDPDAEFVDPHEGIRFPT